MKENSSKTAVCSWNEWDPLKHVIVGRADGTQIQAPEPAVQLDFPDRGYPLGTFGPLPKDMEEKADELLDNFAAILEKRGIRVDRPTPLDFSQAIQTPDWQQGSMSGCMPPRDVLLTEQTYKDDFWPKWNASSEEDQGNRTENSDWIITETEPLRVLNALDLKTPKWPETEQASSHIGYLKLQSFVQFFG